MDLIGEKFGRLTVVRRAPSIVYSYQTFPCWRVRCDCGTVKTVTQSNLRSGYTKSCGCLNIEQAVIGGTNTFIHGESVSYNGGKATKEYRAWQGLKQRCLNPKHKAYSYYGLRGITVCKRWRNSYENFLADVGRAPGPEFSIDRINNDGNYTPRNVRWATAKQQVNNRRVTKH